MSDRRVKAMLGVLAVFLDRPERRLYSLEISELAGMAAGAISPYLARLERQGWILSDWEADPDSPLTVRRRRRVYWLNPNHPDRESVP
jgi:PadR family transcriptional regulator, regulatory protein PadR